MINDFNAWYTKQQLFTRTYVTVLGIFGLIAKFKPSFIMYILFFPEKLLSL
jgi:Derlin-2/3